MEHNDTASTGRFSRALVAILAGGVMAGAFDLSFAFTLWGERGVTPDRILQSIASGVLGRAAYAGGTPTAMLGAGLHFGIAIAMAAAFTLAYMTLAFIRSQPALWGMAYGFGLYVMMNFVVVPLSLAELKQPPFFIQALGLGVHILLVGLPIALVAHECLRNRPGSIVL